MIINLYFGFNGVLFYLFIKLKLKMISKQNEERDLPFTPEKVSKFQRNSIQKTKKAQIHLKKTKQIWSAEQDQLLMKIVAEKGAKDWSGIAENIPERCGKQCRERWHNHLRSGVYKGEWTLQEQWMLALQVNAFGTKWSLIAKCLKRTDNSLKNHWNCKMKPKKSFMNQKIQYYLNLIRQGNTPQLPQQQINLLKIIQTQMYFLAKNYYSQRKQILKQLVDAIKFVKRMRNGDDMSEDQKEFFNDSIDESKVQHFPKLEDSSNLLFYSDLNQGFFSK